MRCDKDLDVKYEKQKTLSSSHVNFYCKWKNLAVNDEECMRIVKKIHFKKTIIIVEVPENNNNIKC